MSKFLSDYVDTAYYASLFSQLTENRYDLVFLDREGELLTKTESASPHVHDSIKELLSRKETAGAYRSTQTVDHIGPSEEIPLFLNSLFVEGKNLIGHICAIGKTSFLQTDDSVHPRLSLALKTLSDGVEKEYSLNNELTLMSEECAGMYEELHLVYEMGEKIMQDPYNENIFGKLIELCIDYLEVDMAVFIRSDTKEAAVSIEKSSGLEQPEHITALLKERVHDFVSKNKKKLSIIEPTDPNRAGMLNNLPLKLLSTPVFDHKKEVKGVLTILRKIDKADFVNSDKKLMVSMAQQFGILLKNRELYNELKIFTNQIAACLIESIDAKDPYTRGHSDRVNKYSLEIGRKMGLPDDELWVLDWASKLHDIGKIGVPDGILTKPEKLTDEEYKVIQMHPERGYEILKPVKFLGPATEGVRHHHEKYDGTGFPHGLKGEEIPLHARIIAVCDTYDAMTSTRAYRSALSHEKALSEIDRVSGKQLDEKIVRFLEIILAENSEISFPGNQLR